MTQGPFPPGVGGGAVAAPKPQGLAVAAMVLGIAAFVVCWIPILNWGALVCAVLAIVLGAVARGKVKRGEAAGGGMATAGLILGLVWVALLVVIVILAVVFGAAYFNFLKGVVDEAQKQQQGSQPQQLFRFGMEAVQTLVRGLLG